jgi:formiminoglutamase
MLQNWLKSVDFLGKDLNFWQLGQNIAVFDETFPDLKNVKIALIGTGEEVNIIRKYLYQLTFPFSKFHIADIGNLHKATDEFLLPVIRELLDNKIIPIILSHKALQFVAQFKAYQNIRNSVNVAVVDESSPWHTKDVHYLATMRKSEIPKLGNLGLIGYQKHLIPPETLSLYRRKNYDLVRLGLAKSRMEEVEPTVRAADTVYFNLAALKQAEAPGLWNNTPNGFTSEEACQVCHYAGINDKLSSIGFYGFHPDKDQNDQTAQLIAHMIWYFLEGIYNRKRDFPSSTHGMIEYIVSFKDYDYNATFWKSTKSGRWWIEMEKDKERKDLIPCTYDDYKLACKDELSERIMTILERYL